jgi:hypothetical protein
MINLKRILKNVLIWFFINSGISLIVFSFLSVSTTIPLLTLFAAVFIMVQIIASFSQITGFSLQNFFLKRFPDYGFIFLFLSKIFAAFFGLLISNQIIKSLFECPIYSVSPRHIVPTMLIVSISIIIRRAINLMDIKHNTLKDQLNSIMSGIKSTYYGKQSISIKEEEQYHVIKFDDLIYLSSHGKKTILHTEENQFTTNQLLKDIEKKLNQIEFVRIHRQFIINKKYFSQIKYFKGGRYFACLNDEDESMLPIGRNISSVKQTLEQSNVK